MNLGEFIKGLAATLFEKDAEMKENAYKYSKMYSDRQLLQKYQYAVRNKNIKEAAILKMALKNKGLDADAIE